jgi:hypothetical protein
MNLVVAWRDNICHPSTNHRLLDVEFVEELAKERPGRELLLQAEPTKKDKKDKSGEHGAVSEEPLPRNAWQWPFVIHTTSLGTHLILAPTAEVRDNWVVKYAPLSLVFCFVCCYWPI